MGLTLTWPSVSNKLYIIERTTDLAQGFPERIASGVLATPPLNTYNDTTATDAGPNFYSIRVGYP